MMKLVRIKGKDEYILFGPDIDIVDNMIGGECLAITDKSLLPIDINVGQLDKSKISIFIQEDTDNNIWDVEIDYDLNVYHKDQLI